HRGAAGPVRGRRPLPGGPGDGPAPAGRAGGNRVPGGAGPHAGEEGGGGGQWDGVGRMWSRREQADIVRTMAVLTINISGRFEEGLDLAWRSHALSGDASPHQRMHATWPVMAALYHLGRWSELLPTVDEHVAAFEQDPAVIC